MSAAFLFGVITGGTLVILGFLVGEAL